MMAVLPAFLCLVVSLVVGMAVCAPFLRDGTRDYPYGYFLSISFGIGIGVLSQLQLIWTVLGLDGNLRWSLDLALAGIAAAWLLRRREFFLPRTRTQIAARPPISPIHKLAYGWSIAVFAASVYLALRQGYGIPYGTGDAVTNWYPKARFLFFSEGSQWLNLFYRDLPHWMHADYPLLLPLTLARGWSYAGDANYIYPVTLHVAGLAATLGLLYFTLNRIHGPLIAAMGLTLFASMPGVYFFTSLQYADGFFMYYITAAATLIVLAVSGPGKTGSGLPLVGLACGFAAWTKNEGWLLLISVGGAFALAWLFRRRTTEDIKRLGMGMLVGATIPLAYKMLYAPANDIVNASTISDLFSLDRLGSRVATLIAKTPPAIFDVGFWHITPIALLVLAMLGANKIILRLAANAEFFTSLGIVVSGYFVALLLIPQDYDYGWFLNFSLSRIYFQILPALILLATLLGFGRTEKQVRPA